MKARLEIGESDFKQLIDNNKFYIDKTYFIEEWYNSAGKVTLITRPRRFGKTLTMSMMEYFLSDRYKDQVYLFENLYIFNKSKNKEEFKKMQGEYPVINLSFAGIKKKSFKQTYMSFEELIANLYLKHDYLLEGDLLKKEEKDTFLRIKVKKADESELDVSLSRLSDFLMRYTGKKVYILLDEYDTPLQEAYSSGYWEELASFISALFENTFKENKALNRAILTGITRVAKESIFSGLNNLEVVTITDEKYARCFGFTEEETFKALDMYNLSAIKDDVKKYYDGFIMGGKVEIYNPWSVINFLDKKECGTYWANTSSNTLIDVSIKKADSDIKQKFEDLMKGNKVQANVDSEIVFKQLDTKKDAIWSLMVASGYLKVCSKKGKICELAITNQEIKEMFEDLIEEWFGGERDYNDFITAMLDGDIDDMEETLNSLSESMFSIFDGGNKPSKLEPERFYHGFVLGLLVDLKDRYVVDSNRESGRGRYDIMLTPKDKKDVGIIIEFKVFSPRKEKTLSDTVSNALNQIEEKKYEQTLIDEGIDTIYKYGIAFCGKECKIGMKDCS